MREKLVHCDGTPTGPGGWFAVSVSAPNTFTNTPAARHSGAQGSRAYIAAPSGGLPDLATGLLYPWCTIATWGMGVSKWLGYWTKILALPGVGSNILFALYNGVGALQLSLDIDSAGVYVLTGTSDGTVPQIDFGGSYTANQWAYVQVEFRRGTGGADGFARLFVNAKQESDGPLLQTPYYDNDARCGSAGLGYFGVGSAQAITVHLDQLKIGTDFNSTSMYQAEWGRHGARAG